MAPFTGIPTHEEQVALALAPKIAGAFSILGSSYIIVDCLKRTERVQRFLEKRQQSDKPRCSWRRGRQQQSSNRVDGINNRRRKRKEKTFGIYQRLMIGLSCSDVLMSVGLFTSTWPMPKDTPYVWGAAGNTVTCEFVGAIEQFGVAAVMYNASLSIYYLLRIRNGWAVTKISKQIEPALHVIPIVFALATVIASLVLDLFNSGLFDCWIAPFPQGCQQSWLTSTGNGNAVPCIRGDNASLYQWVFDLIPKWTSILVVTVNMILIYYSVLRQEQQTMRFSMQQQVSGQASRRWNCWPWRRKSGPPDGGITANNQDRSTSSASSLSALGAPGVINSSSNLPGIARPKPKIAKRLARQSYLYVGALYLTYIPVIVTRATELATGFVYYEMLLTISITIPLQGFWNMLVYVRPRYLRARERQRKEQQRLANLHQNHEESGSKSNTSSLFLKFVSKAVRENAQAVSEAVVEGALEDEEEDFDEETEQVASDSSHLHRQTHGSGLDGPNSMNITSIREDDENED